MRQFIFIFVILFSSNLNKIESKKTKKEPHCDKETCKTGLKWHQFKWKNYIKKDLLEEDYKNPIDRFGLNIVNSIKIGVNRTIPDHRNPQCSKIDWDAQTNGKTYPDVSVIITYRDEPRSTLLRTIVSVFERSREDLIKEIIVIDDNNVDPKIGSALEKLEKVKVIRNEQREGLIRSRIKGTLAATGEVLIFLDSHCEVQQGWLEPLLVRIIDNPKRLVCPVIENINFDRFSMEPVSSYLRGGFDWQLNFFWEYITAKDRQMKLRDPTKPVATPAIAGGLFAINREWFIKSGMYDDGMEIWGGENVEISLRMWMCGGEMEIVPCSKVGHVYKQKNVYTYPKGSKKTTLCNNKRLARTWLDEFEILYNFTLSSVSLKEDCGIPEKMLKIKKELKCKPFQWYLQNVYPELAMPAEGDIAFGQIHSKPLTGFLHCLDHVAVGSDSGLIGLNGCLQTYPPQGHRLTHLGQIINQDFCFTLDTTNFGSTVFMHFCDEKNQNQLWDRVRPPRNPNSTLGGYFLKNRGTKLCLDVSTIKETGLIAKECDENSNEQRFIFTYQIVKA